MNCSESSRLKKWFYFPFFVLFIFAGCDIITTGHTDPIPLLEKNDGDREWYIGFTGTKVDRSGDRQCRNFAYTSYNDSLLEYYGWNPQRTFSSILEVPRSRVSVQRDSLNDRFLSVRLKRVSGNSDLTTSESRQDLLAELCDVLSLKMERIDERVEVKFVTISDYNLLSKHRVEQTEGDAIHYSGGEVNCAASKVSSLINMLNGMTEEEILTDLEDEHLYAFSFEFEGIDDLASALEKYGLVAEKRDTVLSTYTFR